MSSSNSSTSSGIGFTGLLTIVFITLKLLDKIDWSWWWVLSPIWISFSLVIVVLLIVLVVGLVTAIFKK
jgi:membrane protein YdbS with pleckstrin-like domain